MSIRKFLDKEKTKSERFQQLSEGKTDQEKREIEKKLLKPEKLPDYTGPQPIKNSLDKLTVKMVFPDTEAVEMLKRHFKVGQYIEQSINKIDLFVDFLRALDNGTLEYNKNEGTFRSSRQDSPGKPAMDTGKQGTKNRNRSRLHKSKNIKRGA